MSDFFTLRISAIQRATKDAVLISFTVPEKLQNNFTFVAGQYITIKAKIDNKELRRAYSICVAPESNELQIAVKALKDGAFSVFANTQLKEGAVLEVSQPEGRFVLPTNKHKENDYLAFAAGSGITPIMAMLKSVLEVEEKSRFVLVFSNKTKEDVIFREPLKALRLQYPERFFIQYLYSRAQVEGALFGRIDEETVNYCLKDKFKDFNFNSFYSCGPEAMIETVLETLKQAGKPTNSIHFELFTASVNKNIEIKSEATGLTVILDEESETIPVKEKQSILEAVLAAGIDAPYSCQGGVCASCMAKITNGKAKMIKNTVLTDGEVNEGLVLTCQAYLTTATATVDYDAV